jgi:Berberine and berberine like
MQPSAADGVYVNDLSDARQEGENRVGAAYGLNYARLAALKQTDDPTNRFRSNQNIAPAGWARRVGPERSS